jgi:hypothetical protein
VHMGLPQIGLPQIPKMPQSPFPLGGGMDGGEGLVPSWDWVLGGSANSVHDEKRERGDEIHEWREVDEEGGVGGGGVGGVIGLQSEGGTLGVRGDRGGGGGIGDGPQNMYLQTDLHLPRVGSARGEDADADRAAREEKRQGTRNVYVISDINSISNV